MKQTALKVLFVVLVVAAMGMIGVMAGKHGMLGSNDVAVPANKPGGIIRLVLNGRTFCSGTVVSESLVVTAAHCVLMETPFGYMASPGDIEIRPSNNRSLGTYGKVAYTSVQMDQALIVGNFRQYRAHRMITDPALLLPYRANKAIFMSCGYPLNGDLFCNQTTFEKPDNFFWAVKGLLIPGMSGGPTMLADGTVVAVNVAVSGESSIVSPIYNITRNLSGGK